MILEIPFTPPSVKRISPKRVIWPDEQEALLTRLYASTPVRIIAEQIGRRPTEVKERARLLGLKSLPRGKKKTTLHYYNGNPKYIVEANGCWRWIASMNAKGYGVCNGKDSMLAHRQVYIDAKGKVPKGMTVDHTCTKRYCVNIDHLEAVPHVVNVRRGSRTKLTWAIVEEIRSDSKSTVAELAKKFDATVNAVYAVRNGASWNDKIDLPRT